MINRWVGSKNLGTVWSEAGERYLLVLFLDYVFNQSDNMGQPIINYGHACPRAVFDTIKKKQKAHAS